MDNANTITDMAKTQNTVYEIVSDLSGRQDHLEDRLSTIEEKLIGMGELLEGLPGVLSGILGRSSSGTNLLRPESASQIPHSKSGSTPLNKSLPLPTTPTNK